MTITTPDPKVLSTFGWANNAELIAAVASLYLRPTDIVLDPTYMKGNWWKVHRPAHLVTFHRAVDGSDFRALPLEDGSVDAAFYDPPYVCPGGRKTTNKSVKAMHDAFGMDEQVEAVRGGLPDPMFKNPGQLQELMNDGLTEMARVVRRARTKGGTTGGIIVMRCMSYVWGGTFWPGAELTWQHATELGLQTIDRFDLVKPNGGPQPKTNRNGSPRRQQHASRNSSSLWIFRRPPLAKPKLEQSSLDLD